MKLGNIPKDGKSHGHAPMYPPPVPFKKTEKTQKPITKDEYKTVTLKIDPSDESKDSPTIDKKVRLFADGTAEDWLRWRMEWEDVVRDKPLKTGTQHVTMALTLLKGRAKELFQEALKFQQEEGTTDKEDKGKTTVFTKALNDTGRHFFPPERAYQRQRDYMLRYLKMDGSQTVPEFTACLRELNSYLPYFPVKPPRHYSIPVLQGRAEQHTQSCETSQVAGSNVGSKHRRLRDVLESTGGILRASGTLPELGNQRA